MCTNTCTFCSQQKPWRQSWRARDAESVIAELRMLRERFGVDTVEVADEYPTLDRDRWAYILKRLVKEDLNIELLVETRANDIVRDRGILDRYQPH
ncbi:MAG TPA: radical SAM protein [Candidatus Aquicultor sp.]